MVTWCFAYCFSVLSYYATDEGSLELLKRSAKEQLSMTRVRQSNCKVASVNFPSQSSIFSVSV